MLSLFEGQVALVTAGGSGIGRATALRFASVGATVVVADIAPEGGHETVDRIIDAGGEAHFVQADVADEHDVKAMVSAAVAVQGTLSLVHNNAGIGLPGLTAFEDIDVAAFDRVMAVNIRGLFLCLRHQIPELLKQPTSSVVVTSSSASLSGGPGNSPYATSKHAVNGLVQSVALEYGRRGLRVNAVCPSYTRTVMSSRHPSELLDHVSAVSPMGRPAEAQDIAEAVLWLSSPMAAYVNGVCLPVDGGLHALSPDLAPVMQRLNQPG